MLKGNNIIYTLADPFTQEVRYVGLSTKALKRPKKHFLPSACERSAHNSYKNNWIKTVLVRGKNPIIAVVGSWEVISFEELEEAEKYWISYFRGNGSPLTNLTDGGGGMCGYKYSVETRAKIAAASRGNKNCVGKKLPLEVREKISRTLTGKKQSPETIAKRAAVARGKKRGPPTQAVRDKISASKMGKKRSPEVMAKLAASNRGRKHTEEARANMSKAKLGNKNGFMNGVKRRSPNHKPEVGHRKGTKHSVETKMKMSESNKRAWEKRRLKSS